MAKISITPVPRTGKYVPIKPVERTGKYVSINPFENRTANDHSIVISDFVNTSVPFVYDYSISDSFNPNDLDLYTNRNSRPPWKGLYGGDT